MKTLPLIIKQMAEYIYRSMLEKRMAEGEIEAAAVKVTSSGVFADIGSAGSSMAEEVLHVEYDIDGREHRARAFTYEVGPSRRKLKHSQGMACWSCVKYYMVILFCCLLICYKA